MPPWQLSSQKKWELSTWLAESGRLLPHQTMRIIYSIMYDHLDTSWSCSHSKREEKCINEHSLKVEQSTCRCIPSWSSQLSLDCDHERRGMRLQARTPARHRASPTADGEQMHRGCHGCSLGGHTLEERHTGSASMQHSDLQTKSNFSHIPTLFRYSF